MRRATLIACTLIFITTFAWSQWSLLTPTQEVGCQTFMTTGDGVTIPTVVPKPAHTQDIHARCKQSSGLFAFGEICDTLIDHQTSMDAQGRMHWRFWTVNHCGVYEAMTFQFFDITGREVYNQRLTVISQRDPQRGTNVSDFILPGYLYCLRGHATCHQWGPS